MEQTSLKGQLLIATPSLLDPNFRRSVVFVLEHTPEGAVGVVLNRPTGVAAGEAVPELAPLMHDDDQVFVGGPVQPRSVIALAEFAQPDPADEAIVGPIAPIDVGAGVDEVAERVSRVRVFAGYAGWGEGQLDDELTEEAWFTEPALPGDVFADDAEQLWNRVLGRMGSQYRLIASMPDDPSLN